MPAISVIVPAYNADRFIAECVNSVRVQDFDDWELIVVDDGSTDETKSVVMSSAADDPRIRYVRQDHSNAGVARNYGMKLARGEYLYFLDADDFIDPGALSSLLQAARDSHADVVVCGSHYYDNETHQVKPIDFTMLCVETDTPLNQGLLPERPFQSFVGWPWDKLFSAGFVEEKELVFQEQRSSNDALFVFLALCEASCVMCLDKDLVSHRTNNKGSLEFTRSKSWRNAIAAMSNIGDELKRRKLDRRYWASYVNWVAHFSYWSVTSLGVSDVPDKVILAFDEFQRSLGVEEELYFDEEELTYARLSCGDRAALIRAFLCERDSKNKRIDQLYSNEKALMASIARLEHELEEAGRKQDTLLNSRPYKIGKAMTKLPRKMLGK